MKVFVAGATGAIGRQLVPRLLDAGHEVHGMTRSASKQQLLRDMGAEPAVADALDADQVAQAVAKAEPDVIVHELTAIGPMDLRHFDRAFEATNRLRTQGTDHLLSAGQAAGVKRFVAQSFFAAYERTGGPVKSEEDSFGPHPAKEMRETVAAIRHVEDAVLAATWTEGIVLRYGGFYGPGTSLGPDGEQTEAVRRAQVPAGREGVGRMVLHPHRGRRRGDRSGRRARASRGVQHRRRRARSGRRVAARRWRGHWVRGGRCTCLVSWGDC